MCLLNLLKSLLHYIIILSQIVFNIVGIVILFMHRHLIYQFSSTTERSKTSSYRKISLKWCTLYKLKNLRTCVLAITSEWLTQLHWANTYALQISLKHLTRP